MRSTRHLLGVSIVIRTRRVLSGSKIEDFRDHERLRLSNDPIGSRVIVTGLLPGILVALAVTLSTTVAVCDGYRPVHVGLFAGAVKYTRYGPFTRLFFKLFSAVTTGDTDTSRDCGYTNWDEVEAFAADFAALAERRIAAEASHR